MGYLDYGGDTTGKSAFLDKIKEMLTELYTTYVAEIEDARGTDTDLGARLDTFQDDITTYVAEIEDARGTDTDLGARLDTFRDDITLLGNAELPIQTGNSGKSLITDGSTSSWANRIRTDEALSVDSELVLFDGVTGQKIKRSADTGLVSVASGVVSIANITTKAEADTSSGAVDVTLTSASNRVQKITITAADKYVNLPDATGLYKGADTYVIINDGDYRFGIKDNSGGFIASVAPHSQGRLSLLDNSTAAGTWKASSPADLIMNTLKTECNTDASDYIASCALSATELFVAWGGTGADGFCAVLTFGATITVSNILEFDTTQANFISCDAISATVVAVAYSGTDSDGYIAAITWDGTDTLTVTDTYEFKDADTITNTNVHVITSALVFVAYQNTNKYTVVQVLSWDGANFGSTTAESTLGGIVRYYPKTAKISGDATDAKFVLLHSGAAITSVFSAIITWNSSTGFAIGSDTSTVGSVNSSGYHMPVVIDSTYFMVAGMKSADSGISLNMVLCSISGTTITNKRYLFSDQHDFSYAPIGGFLFDSDTVFLFTSEKNYENYLYKIKVVGAADTKDCILQIQNKIPIGFNAEAIMQYGDTSLLSGSNAAIVYRNALASNYLYAEKVEIA
jgi:hypothetical protein